MNMEQMAQWLSQMMPSRTSNDSIQAPGSGADVGAAQGAPAFTGVMDKAVDAVQKPASAAMDAVDKFARGSEGEIHQTMMTLEKSDISFKFFVVAKNKAIEAYKEIMRMG